MELIQRMETMIFEKTLNYPSVQILKNKTIIIQAQCYVEVFTEDQCVVKTSYGDYRITGKNLSLSEYADFILKIQSDGILKVEIEGDHHEE